MKPTKCLAREKKTWCKKREKGGRREGEKYLETLPSAQAWTSQANILHLQSEGREVNDLQTALW